MVAVTGENGTDVGYHPNALKCWLIVKPNKSEEATEAFQNIGINVTTEGRRHLGAPLGSRDFLEDYVTEAVKTLVPARDPLLEGMKFTTTAVFCEAVG